MPSMFLVETVPSLINLKGVVCCLRAIFIVLEYIITDSIHNEGYNVTN